MATSLAISPSGLLRRSSVRRTSAVALAASTSRRRGRRSGTLPCRAAHVRRVQGGSLAGAEHQTTMASSPASCIVERCFSNTLRQVEWRPMVRRDSREFVSPPARTDRQTRTIGGTAGTACGSQTMST